MNTTEPADVYLKDVVRRVMNREGFPAFDWDIQDWRAGRIALRWIPQNPLARAIAQITREPQPPAVDDPDPNGRGLIRIVEIYGLLRADLQGASLQAFIAAQPLSSSFWLGLEGDEALRSGVVKADTVEHPILFRHIDVEAWIHRQSQPGQPPVQLPTRQQPRAAEKMKMAYDSAALIKEKYSGADTPAIIEIMKKPPGTTQGYSDSALEKIITGRYSNMKSYGMSPIVQPVRAKVRSAKVR